MLTIKSSQLNLSRVANTRVDFNLILSNIRTSITLSVFVYLQPSIVFCLVVAWYLSEWMIISVFVHVVVKIQKLELTIYEISMYMVFSSFLLELLYLYLMVFSLPSFVSNTKMATRCILYVLDPPWMCIQWLNEQNMPKYGHLKVMILL